MKHIFTFLIIFLTLQTVTAQDRYTSEVFSDAEITVTSNVPYGSNAEIFSMLFLGATEFLEQTLVMDVYQPDPNIDTERARPMVLVVHGGDGLPEAVNMTCVGSKTDQTTVDTARKLARMGYVAVAPSYRQGWNPLQTQPDLFLDGLVDAALRAATDLRTAARFLRQDIAENGNTYGIDPDRFSIWGTSTSAGTYSGFATYVNEEEEVQTETYFVTDPVTGEVRNVVDLGLNGGLFGLEVGMTADGDTTNYVNSPGFSSAFQMSALGSAISLDPGIIDADEPPMIMFGNPVSPVTSVPEGPIALPTTGMVVALAQLSRGLIAEANAVGINDVWSNFSFFDDISQQVADDPIFMGVEGWLPIYGDPGNVYPWVSWTDCPNANNPGNLTTFPGADRAEALIRIDTMAAYFGVRACVALNLGCEATSTADPLVGSDLITISPNPASDVIVIKSERDVPMEAADILDLNGRLISRNDINGTEAKIRAMGMESGMYNVLIRYEDGVAVKRIVIQQ